MATSLPVGMVMPQVLAAIPRKAPCAAARGGQRRSTGGRISAEETREDSFEAPKLSAVARVLGSAGDGRLRDGSPSGRREPYNSGVEKSAGGRRGFLAWSLVLSTAAPWPLATEVAAAEDAVEVPLESYKDPKDGFTLLRPSPWNKVDKPGAAIFFEDPKSKSNNIGVTVAPVRIASLDGFGTVDDIVKKLVKAEREKPSTNDMQVLQVLERKVGSNRLYSLEYTLDTTRGNKRILTGVTVASYKLYILNIIFVNDPVAPAWVALNDALHQVLNSFELSA